MLQRSWPVSPSAHLACQPKNYLATNVESMRRTSTHRASCYDGIAELFCGDVQESQILLDQIDNAANREGSDGCFLLDDAGQGAFNFRPERLDDVQLLAALRGVELAQSLSKNTVNNMCTGLNEDYAR